jgi:hypothetical protein
MHIPPPNPLMTKSDLQNAFLSLEAPILALADPDAAGFDFGPNRAWYPIQPTRLETVARYLWGLAPFTAGGGVSKGWPVVLDAITHGTDPNHPQYWGPVGTNDQRSVEMASLGVALTLVPEKIWNPLNAEQKDRLANWMGSMVGKPLVHSNWQFFRLLVTLGLRHIDRAPANADTMDQQAIDLIDSMYIGDGWYTDGGGGGGGQRDYYIPMAFEFYSTLLANFSRSGPVVARAKEWKDRARQFAGDFVHWFANDGSALPFGRSLTYRFAQGAFWGGCAVTGIDALSPGQLKGLLLRHMRWWWKQPMLNGDGTLSLGYCYPNMNMLEPYNAAGSPYWAFKAMAALQLPDDHPFWTAKEEPLGAPGGLVAQKHPRLLIDRDPDSGHITALNAGQWHPGWPLRHRDAKYAKLVYSTFFGPTVGPNRDWLSGAGIDSTLSVQLAKAPTTNGTLWQNRGLTATHVVQSDHVASDWVSVTGVTIRSWLIPAGPAWHVRVHRVETDHDIQLAEGGFAAEEPELKTKTGSSVLAIGLQGGLTGMIDLTGGRSVELNDAEPNSSLYHSRVMTPVLTAALPPGTHWLATAVFGATPGSKASFDPAPKVDFSPGSKVSVRGAGATIEIDLSVANPVTVP